MNTFFDAKTFNLVDSKGNILDTKIIEIPCHYPSQNQDMQNYIEELEKTEFFSKLKNLKRYCKNESGENEFSLTGIFGALIQGIILSAREMYKPQNQSENSKEKLMDMLMRDEISLVEFKEKMKELETQGNSDNGKKGKWIVAKDNE